MKDPARNPEERLRAPELIRGAFFGLVLVWINAYVCREMFLRSTPKMNSMQGFWIAMARHAEGGWFHSEWWRYWDAGLPVELAYAPLVPALTAWTAAIGRIPHAAAFQMVSGAVYCLGPLTLFVMAWLLTRAVGYAFAAGVFYSLTAPSQLLIPDTQFSFVHFWDARRLNVIAIWDETPHMAALTALPLVILFLSLAIRKRRPIYYAAAVLAISVAALASDFGPVLTVMASLCLLFVLRREDLSGNLLVTAGIGLFSWAICSPFLSPSKIHATRAASASVEQYWSAGSFTALAIVGTGWAILWYYLPRWTNQWPVQFFTLFAWVTCTVPLMYHYLNRQYLPQPGRYLMEMEFSLALLVVFAARGFMPRIPRSVRVWLVLLLIALASEQTATLRKWTKGILATVDVTHTIEYRVAMFAHNHLPGVRVMLPGSIAQWANAFTDIEQFSGGSWSVAYNPAQQVGLRDIMNGADTPEEDARISIAWLKAFGAGAIAVSGPKSPEFWKGFAHPGKFEGILPVLWREEDTTVYQVPQRSVSLAHVVPESAVVQRAPLGRGDSRVLTEYVAALEDDSLPTAEFHWEGTNRIHIRTVARPGQAVSVQVTHHPGWHAKVNGVARQIGADGLGLMWLRPGCDGPCDVQLEYDGGTELWITRLLRAIALLTVAIFLGRSAIRRVRTAA